MQKVVESFCNINSQKVPPRIRLKQLPDHFGSSLSLHSPLYRQMNSPHYHPYGMPPPSPGDLFVKKNIINKIIKDIKKKSLKLIVLTK